MILKRFPTPLLGALAAALAAGLVGIQGDAFASFSGSGVPHHDDDLDGLDNATELRLGLDPDFSNLDGDSLEDLGEVLLGTDPRQFDQSGSLPAPSAQVCLEAYLTGNTFVLQVFTMRKQRVNSLRFHLARPNPDFPHASNVPVLTQSFGLGGFGRFVDRSENLSMPGSRYGVHSLRLLLPAAQLQAMGTFAIAVVADVDNSIKVADEIRFTTEAGILHEWRADLLAARTDDDQGGGSSSSGQPGGLFPADPHGGPSIGENHVNQVCVQQLGATGISGLGVYYTITEAECETLYGALCLATCSATAGDSYVGLDLPSLLQ